MTPEKPILLKQIIDLLSLILAVISTAAMWYHAYVNNPYWFWNMIVPTLLGIVAIAVFVLLVLRDAQKELDGF